MAAKDQRRVERSKWNPLLQNFKTAHKHIKISSITEEPLAELTPEASQIPPVRFLEGWFLSEFSPFQAAAECIHICDTYLRQYQQTFLIHLDKQRQNKPQEPTLRFTRLPAEEAGTRGACLNTGGQTSRQPWAPSLPWRSTGSTKGAVKCKRQSSVKGRARL